MEEMRGRRLTDRDSLSMCMQEYDRIADIADKFSRVYVITADELRGAFKNVENEDYRHD